MASWTFSTAQMKVKRSLCHLLQKECDIEL